LHVKRSSFEDCLNVRVSMPRRIPFSQQVLRTVHNGKGLRIKAGTTHRFIGIWVVVVKRRVFVRSWSVTSRGWYRAFLKDPHGLIQVAGRSISIIAVPTRDRRVRDAVDRAYLAKYATPGARPYAKDLGRPTSRATTLELRPA
jgi:hypothetical protein